MVLPDTQACASFLILFIITMLCFTLTRLSSDPMAQYANKQGMTAADREAIRVAPGPRPAHPGPVCEMARPGFAG